MAFSPIRLVAQAFQDSSRLPQSRGERLGVHGAPEKVALKFVATPCHERSGLFLCLHGLSNYLQVECLPKADDGARDRRGLRPGDASHKRLIDLQAIGRKLA